MWREQYVCQSPKGGILITLLVYPLKLILEEKICTSDFLSNENFGDTTSSSTKLKIEWESLLKEESQ